MQFEFICELEGHISWVYLLQHIVHVFLAPSCMLTQAHALQDFVQFWFGVDDRKQTDIRAYMQSMHIGMMMSYRELFTDLVMFVEFAPL